jgi:K+ transporter
MLNLPGALAPDVAPLVRKPLGPLVIGAIGIVFGDIGTSRCTRFASVSPARTVCR